MGFLNLFGGFREYIKEDEKGNYIKASRVDKGWEITIGCKGKTLKYGASYGERTFWSSRKDALEIAEGIYKKGIPEVYAEEHRHQYGM